MAASPSKLVNPKDPSGLRRIEDRKALEVSESVDEAVKQIMNDLNRKGSPTAKDIEEAVEKALGPFDTELKAKLTSTLKDTYKRSVVRTNQLVRSVGVTIAIGPVTPVQKEVLSRIEVGALADATKLSADLRQKITQSLLAGTAAGEGADELSRRVARDTGIERNRAELIVRTEVMNAYRATSSAHYARYGISEEEWFTAQDGRVCDECRALHGTRYKIGQRPHVHGGTDIQCRCVGLPVAPE